MKKEKKKKTLSPIEFQKMGRFCCKSTLVYWFVRLLEAPHPHVIETICPILLRWK